MTEPTNNDLLIAVQHQEKVFKEHTEEDKINFDALHTKIDAILEGQKETMEFMKGVGISIGIFKFTWNNAAKIGAFIGLLVGLFLVAKYAFLGLFTVFSNNK